MSTSPDAAETASSQIQGRAQGGTELLRSELARLEADLGPLHPNTLRVRSDLATEYREVGRLDEAIALRERVVTETEQVLGSQDPETLAIRSKLATDLS